MKITQSAQIKKLFDYMYVQIGSETNPDIETYRNRLQTVTRESFFRECVWAIWVAGKSRVSADAFLNRASQHGFVYNYQIIATWNEDMQNKFLKAVNGWKMERGRPVSRPVPAGAKGRWGSIFAISRELASYPNDEAFQQRYFQGKARSSSLDAADIKRLDSMKIPYIGPANAQFIIRNMGAEAIKEDRWIKAFLFFGEISRHELEQLLNKAHIPLGLFDAVLWCYCEKFVVEVKNFNSHFQKVWPCF